MGVELCPVQVRNYEFKCQDSEFLDVDKMLGEPHMRGVKRKFSSDSDDRIFSNIVCSHQRQSIFNLSMCKLTRFRQHPEPSLLHSVLIFNTLRSLERDSEKDGLRLNCCLNSSLFPASSPVTSLSPGSMPNSNGCQDSSLNASFFYNLNPSNSSHTAPSSELPHEENIFWNNISDCGSDNDMKCRSIVDPPGRITPFTRSLYDRVDAGAMWNDDTDRLTSLNWSSVLNFNFSSNSTTPTTSPGTSVVVDSNKSNLPENSEACLHTLMPAPQGSLSTSLATLSNCINPILNNGNVISSLSTFNNGTEETFGDIDLSLYDFDVLSPLSPPNVKLAPVSAEELMKSIASASEASSVSIIKGNSGNVNNVNFYNDDKDNVTKKENVSLKT